MKKQANEIEVWEKVIERYAETPGNAPDVVLSIPDLEDGLATTNGRDPL